MCVLHMQFAGVGEWMYVRTYSVYIVQYMQFACVGEWMYAHNIYVQCVPTID